MRSVKTAQLTQIMVTKKDGECVQYNVFCRNYGFKCFFFPQSEELVESDVLFSACVLWSGMDMDVSKCTIVLAQEVSV